MAGIAQTDRLSLPDAPNMSKEERMQKNKEVNHLARESRLNVTRVANAVSKFILSKTLISLPYWPLLDQDGTDTFLTSVS